MRGVTVDMAKNKGLTVLSLFDGMSCGRLALERAGIKVDNYYASEIEKSSMAVTMAHYPDTIQLGNAMSISYKNGVLTSENGTFDVGHIDLLIGGSPCTNFSSIGNQKGMTSENGQILNLSQYLSEKKAGNHFNGESYLFWEYVRLLKEVNPDFFLLENVTMAKKWAAIITENVGVEPIAINSALLSAQNRPRLYWTNINGVKIPDDAGILLDDILMKSADKSDVSSCQTVQKVYPRLISKYGYIPMKFNSYNASEIKDKACALSKGSMITSSCATLIFVKTKNGVHTVANGLLDGKYPTKLKNGSYNIRRLSLEEMEKLQTVPVGYTDIGGIGRQKRSAMLGNGWTVDVISHILSYMEGV